MKVWAVTSWDTSIFDEYLEVVKNQIVWGGANYL